MPPAALDASAPGMARSSTATLRPAWASRSATEHPWMPAPITTTSAFMGARLRPAARGGKARTGGGLPHRAARDGRGAAVREPVHEEVEDVAPPDFRRHGLVHERARRLVRGGDERGEAADRDDREDRVERRAVQARAERAGGAADGVEQRGVRLGELREERRAVE